MSDKQEVSSFDQWCIVELMGHQRIAGKVTEESHFGAALMRVDVPAVDGRDGFTKFYGGGAIYAITPVSEEVARGIAQMLDPSPINRWEMRQLLPAPEHDGIEDNADDEHGHDEDDAY